MEKIPIKENTDGDISEYLHQRKQYFEAKERKAKPLKACLVLAVFSTWLYLYIMYGYFPGWLTLLIFAALSISFVRTSSHGDHADRFDQDGIVFPRVGITTRPFIVPTTPALRVIGGGFILGILLLGNLYFAFNYESLFIRRYQPVCQTEGLVAWGSTGSTEEQVRAIEDCMKNKGFKNYSYNEHFNPLLN